MSTLKVGDKVRVIKIEGQDYDTGMTMGDIGVIDCVNDDLTYKRGLCSVKFKKTLYKTDDNGNFKSNGSYHMWGTQLKLIEEKEILKVGDTVRVINNYTDHRFEIGEIVRCTDVVGTFEHLDGSDYWMMNESDYEIIENKEEDEMVELKVGYRVTVIGNTSFHQFEIGEVVKLIELRSSKMHKFTNGEEYWFMKKSDYEILSNKFKIINTCGHYFELGEVVEWLEGDWYVNKEGTRQILEPKNIVPISIPEVIHPVPKVTPPTVLDTPIIESNSMCKFITIGTITIAVPKDTPLGISRKHPDDEFNSEIGQALSQARLLDEVFEIVNKPKELEVGDKFKVIGNKGHHFKIGEIVTLINIDYVDNRCRYVNEENIRQWVYDEDLEAYND